MDELKIIQYLDGELSGGELRDFEEEIRMNPPLAEELKKFRQIQELARKLMADREAEDGGLDPGVEKEISDAVRDYKRDPSSFKGVPPEYRVELQRAEQAFMERRRKASSMQTIRRIWFSAAAVIVLAIIASMLIFRPFARMSPSEIYAHYFTAFQKTDMILELARNDNDFLFAVEVYEAEDYERAAVLFEMLSDSSEVRAWSLFYAGSSYMSLNRLGRAEELFRVILREGDEEVVPAARWHLALCYIRMGNTDRAREQLEILGADPGYRRDAGRVLHLLE